MKSLAFVFLFSLSPALLAQTLPDEINYGPYQARYQELVRQTNEAQSRLDQDRSALAEARRFIREMNDHIDSLEDGIRQDQSEISRLQSLIPQLQSQMQSLNNQRAQVDNELRSRQNDEDNLEARQAQSLRDLQPLEQQLAREEGRLRDMQSDLSNEQRQLRDAESRLAQATNEARRIDDAFERERGDQRRMEQELASIQGRLSQVEGQINSTQSAMASQQASLSNERAKLDALNGRVQEYQNELSSLRSSGATPEQIQAAERKVSAATNARDNTQNSVRDLERQVSQSENQIRQLQSQANDLRRDQSNLPARISQSQQRQSQLQAQRGQVQQDLNRAQNEAQITRQRVDRLAQTIDQQRNQVRNAEANVLRQRQIYEALGRDIDNVRRIISDLANQSRSLSSQVASLSDQIRTHQATIPRLENEIRQAQNEISDGQRDIARAQTDERNLVQAVARDESQLASVTSSRNAAQVEMDNRVALYQRYLGEAQQLGANQTTPSIALGEKEGSRLSGVLSAQNGNSVGTELGFAQAKLWGSVRGELQGYALGFDEGNTSVEETNRAAGIATADATKAAEAFAQTNFKPVFFEEYVQEAFKRPVAAPAKMLMMQNLVMTLETQAAIESIDPLTPQELQASQALTTPLDAAIEENKKTVKAVEAKAQRLSDPSVAFVAPTVIPFGSVDCKSVYKGLQIYLTACQDSYKSTFANSYVSNARKTFTQSYNGQFSDVFNVATINKREASFMAEFNAAHATARAEGVRVGKQTNYNRTYDATYKKIYAEQLEVARAKAKSDANRELGTFLASNPLLTLAESALSAQDFRGGESVDLIGKVKNVGQKAFQGASVVRITDVQNATVLTAQAILSQAGAQVLTAIPSLKVQVLPTAKTGEKLVVKGVIELPGDLYKPARQEKFELVQVLTANPANDLKLDYDASPAIKGLFNRYIHAFRPTITPTVEDISAGYSVSLSAVGENAGLIEIREAKFDTGALAVNTAKEGKFSYVFKDAAKNKVVSLEVAVTYAGKVIKKQVVELRPH